MCENCSLKSRSHLLFKKSVQENKMAVAVFATEAVIGEAVAIEKRDGVQIIASFTKLPPGKHGFHIHVAGDLRGEGCAGACAHWHVGKPANHGSHPSIGARERHTGDLGNIERTGVYRYFLRGIKARELWGRSLIVHADEDDLGLGNHEDSKTTGHSGARIACAIFGRVMCTRKTRKR